MRRFVLAICIAGAGCTVSQLQQTGVDLSTSNAVATISQDAVQGGQLFCMVGTQLVQAGAVKVNGATSQSVAQACTALTILTRAAGLVNVSGTPVAVQAGQSAILASVDPAAAATVHP